MPRVPPPISSIALLLFIYTSRVITKTPLIISGVFWYLVFVRVSPPFIFFIVVRRNFDDLLLSLPSQ